MPRHITLCYRKLIDVNATTAWDKLVFEDSYLEFKLQAQNFTTGTNYTSYAEIMHHIPAAAGLAGMVSPAITGYMQQLHNIIPDLLNNLGKRFLTFSNFQFEIINSSVVNRNKHHVGINFYSDELVWHDTVGTYLLLSAASQPALSDGEIGTHLFQLPPYVNIHTLKSTQP